MKEIKENFHIFKCDIEFFYLTTTKDPGFILEMFERRRGSQQHWENSRSKFNELSRVRIICIEVSTLLLCVSRVLYERIFLSHLARRISQKKVSKNLSDLGNFSKDWTQKKTFWSIRTKSFFEIKKNRYEEVQWTTAEESFNRQWPYVLVTLLARSLLHFPRTFRLLSSGWMKIALNIFTNAYNQLYAHSERCAVCSNTTPENKNIQVEGCDEILDPLKTRTSQHKNIFRLVLPKK